MVSQSKETSLEKLLHDKHIKLQDQIDYQIGFFHAEMMNDMMHMHWVIRQLDYPKFLWAMQKADSDTW